MLTTFPTNTIVLIVAGLMATGAATWFILMQGFKRLTLAQDVKQRWQWSIALVLIGWLLVRLLLGVTLPIDSILGVPLIVAFIGFGLLAGTLPLLISPVFRQAIQAIPLTWLVGIHTLRLLGFAFLALLDMKLLPAEFALSAGYGDVAVALLALAVVYLLVRRNPNARLLTIGWIALGLLDFVVALVSGMLYIRPFATQLAADGIALTYLTYVLIVPAYGVPLFTLSHLYALFQLFAPQVNHSQPLRGGTLLKVVGTKAN